MTEQIHKRLTEEQVEMILNRYNNNELSREQAMELLGLKQRQFFEWLKKDRENRKDFSIDYSRYMLLYADIMEKETTWRHITALESVWLRHGFPLSYYVDSHSIFRFIEKRDSIWSKHHLKTDEVDPQWKKIMRECRVQVTYALSPQAKGKIERPYRWLQDRIVRTCAGRQKEQERYCFMKSNVTMSIRFIVLQERFL